MIVRFDCIQLHSSQRKYIARVFQQNARLSVSIIPTRVSIRHNDDLSPGIPNPATAIKATTLDYEPVLLRLSDPRGDLEHEAICRYNLETYLPNPSISAMNSYLSV